MFKEMRKQEKKLTNEEMYDILARAEYGVLSTVGEDGYPYGVPVNFVYMDEAIYFHCANEGHKVENIEFNNKVSFCAAVDVELIPEEFNTRFKSIIAFGEAKEVFGEEKIRAFLMIIEKFSNEFYESGVEYVKKAGYNAVVYKIKPEHMTAKGKK